MLTRPIFIYDNWTAYDELSDNIELTEELAILQFKELLRLRDCGARFDYYLMDAFWFAQDGGYRTWRKPHWPDGPERFIQNCLENNVKPGLWIGGNNLFGLSPVPAWENSLADNYNPALLNQGSLCLFYGGFLQDLLETLRMWYEKGIRLFKFDFLNLNAATTNLRSSMLPSEIRHANELALIAGLTELRKDCPDVVLTGYNGFEEAETQTNTSLPFRKTISTNWLNVFDSMYCGDPRPSDVPVMNFWRSMDIYSDHMCFVYQRNGYPLQRIDNCSFMIGIAGSCYARAINAWKGMLILSLARGGWVNSYHGNLELLDDKDGVWFARAQDLFYQFQLSGRISTIGEMPGNEQPYGFLAENSWGSLITMVNPGYSVSNIILPSILPGRILFTDSGYKPTINENNLSLGAGQMALVGFGKYADSNYDLGIQQDVHIPEVIETLTIDFISENNKVITTKINPPKSGYLHLIMRQFDSHGKAFRSSAGSPPDGKPLDQILILSASQSRRAIPIKVQYDKAIWSGLSWAAGEIDMADLDHKLPLDLRFETKETVPVYIKSQVYWVNKMQPE